MKVIMGVCIFISPRVIGFTAQTMAFWDALMIGILAAIVALGNDSSQVQRSNQQQGQRA